MFLACIGDGSSTSLWFDYWLANGKGIIDMLPLRLLVSTGLYWNAKPRTHVEDHSVWKGHSSGKFIIDSAWEMLRDSRPANTLHHLLWFQGHIYPTPIFHPLACFSGASAHHGELTKIALAPAVLASLYKNLRSLKEQAAAAVLLRVLLPFQVPCKWAFERFPLLGPQCPNLLKHGEPGLLDGTN
uniref:Reverse transcriptase zinc-binding domain-containing protein n=1 Tax=Populus alba TaxID=43335 RepID=A0A4U5N0P4_POPAL|nr:hypothetical protein D5086_0000284980 [Populus alba]